MGWRERRSGRDTGAPLRAVLLACCLLWAGGCSLVATPTPEPPIGANPFTNTTWFIDPESNARKQADAWRKTRPADATAIELIAKQPQADWFGDGGGDVRAAVDARVGQITKRKALPILVAHNIPNRDCGGLSNGGATSTAAYGEWIRAFAEGIGTRRAVVILEPNALIVLDCLDAAGQEARFAALRDAVAVLRAKPRVAVYLDAGHADWAPAEELARHLTAAGIAQANGFALNTAYFHPSALELAYGRQIAPLVGGKHFVIDTSRNGVGPTDGPNVWCNPSGQGLGQRPTVVADDPYLDAYLWIKRPGESDGACNGNPAAGTWWPDYALGLAQRAALDGPAAGKP